MRIIHTIIFIFTGQLCKGYFRIFCQKNADLCRENRDGEKRENRL